MRERTRRNVLCSIAGAAALAGCSESTSTGGELFENVTVDNTELVVKLADDTSGNIAITNPDGELFAEADRTSGETQLTFELGVDYTPGEYEIALVESGERSATTSLDIHPNLEIVDIGIGENHPDRMPDSLGKTADVECFVELRNTGTGPTAIQQLEFSGDVPNPTALHNSESGIFDDTTGQGERDRIILNPDSADTIFSSTLPFSFEGEGTDCKEERQEGECLITITGTNYPNIEQQFLVEYPSADEYDACRPEIIERG
ncbi:hypothetical protein HWV23_10495 [Natronomonas halophila]|uniref:hypothetical protein n=1 Tax=Natronomonas halophila TaxID=2747817 RepID=UPI0015B5FBBB|nr:hypothetical protein [Natronomonas halophila]QLD86136.1 hypothetical protein HWV23_10495 [Natronomonas halophila]